MMTARDRHRIELVGWLVFVASACLFTWSGFSAGDVFSTAGSLLFLVACFVFLAPLLKRPVGESE